jgi:multiple sugar transport system ATP-binding protein
MNSILKIKNVNKNFGMISVLNDINIDIKSGDFLVLVGPSGCGKSTLLNCIAGLEKINSGDVFIDNKNMSDVAPKDRDIAMVFQSYALYPTMTVEKNITFGMKVRGITEDVQKEKLKEVAKQLQIENLLKRKPGQLSGGQRQRVAMGRALVRNPRLFLFDEPLSNLDAKLRVEMRTEIKRLHYDLGASMVYVTHDQIEAMTLATKIVVMKDGFIQQIGTPAEIYNYPENIFVADFMGSPPMNLINATAIKEKNHYKINIKMEDGSIVSIKEKNKSKLPEDLLLGIRPENITETSLKNKQNCHMIRSKVDIIEPAGSDTFVVTKIGNTEVTARFNSETQVSIGSEIDFVVDLGKISYFDKLSGQRI